MAKPLHVSLPILFLSLLMVQQNEKHNIFTNATDDDLSYLDPEITYLCPKDKNDTMFIKGNNVKVSYFVRTNGDIYNLCKDSVDLKYIHAFALNSLIIDKDVDVSGSQLKLFFIAPTWVVIGSRKIAVDGTKGEYIPKADDGNDTNMDGSDGKPGLPGGPGGHFFGIGESFVNGKSLTITANGGIGGAGQYGGDGYSQRQARYVDTRALGKIWCGLYYDICRGKEKKYQLNLLDNYGNYSDFYCQGLYEKENLESCSYKIFGWEGGEGGRGGNGGRGGKGGLPGSVMVLELENSSQIHTYNMLGIYGKDGKGGIGGRSGQNGYNIIYEDVYFLAPPQIKIEVGQEFYYHFGFNGSDGCNSVGYNDSVEEAEVLDSADILNTINEYKTWLRDSFVHIKSDSHLITFYKQLDANSYVRNIYNTSQFLIEVQSIDEEFSKLKTTIEFLPFYESLLSRIYFYAEKYNNDSKRVEDRQILSILYTDILGRVYNFNEHAETYLVIEIPQYLEMVKGNLQKVNELITADGKFSRVAEKLNELNKYKEKYDNQVHELIEKSRRYVKMELIGEMKVLLENEKIQTNDLVSDIINFNERPLNNEQELLKWGKNLQDSLIVKSNLYSIGLIIEMLSILPDFAEIVCSVVDLGAEIPEALRFEQNPTSKTNFSSEALKDLYTKTESIKTEEVIGVSNLLQNILNVTKNNPEILFDVTEEVLVLHKTLLNNNRFLTVNALRSDLLHAVKIKRDELSTMNLDPSVNIHTKAYKHIVTARSAFLKLNTVIKINALSRGFVNLYSEYESDASKLEIIIKYIDKAFNTLNVEKSNEDIIYIAVYQFLQRIEDMVLDASNDSGKVSKIASEVVKWNIPLILDDIKQKTQHLKDNQQGKSDLMHVTRNLGIAFSKLTRVFELIKNYLQQRQLENHIADTTNAIKEEIKFTDLLFANKYDLIKKAFGSNLVVNHYKKASDTFKQYVFPIADFYLNDIILPSHFNIYDDVANTVAVAMTQIDIMLRKVDEYKESMLNGDEIMSRKEFGGRKFNSAKPFFVWKNEHHKDTIAKLLSGNNVTVNADITKSDLDDDAIKFNLIDFYFTSKNESVQESVNFIMADFEISVRHLGNSHYRYGDKIYLITSDNLSITYCYEINEDTGRPEKVGGAYDFVKNIDITLSPYALWNIQLIPLWEDVSFDSLFVFKDIVDLEMGGNGNYISKERSSNLDLKVEQFYKPISKY